MPKAKTIVINLGAQVVWRIEHCDGYMLAICDALGLTADGEDEKELRKNVDEILVTLFTHLILQGELDQYLRRAGWTAQPTPIPRLDPGDTPRFKVPFQLVRPPKAAAAYASH